MNEPGELRKALNELWGIYQPTAGDWAALQEIRHGPPEEGTAWERMASLHVARLSQDNAADLWAVRVISTMGTMSEVQGADMWTCISYQLPALRDAIMAAGTTEEE